MKKILILTVSAGEGHNSVAKAISNKLKTDENNIVRTINLFKDLSSEFKYRIVDEGYILSCRYLLGIFNSIFERLTNLNPLNREKSPAQLTIKRETPELLKSIYNFKPDVIILTHCLPAVILTNLRKIYPINSTIIGILTDYMVHPFWESCTGIDYIVTPSEALELEVIKRGFTPEQIKPFGLPIREQFNIKLDKLETRSKLGLKKDMFTVLVMNGGAFGKTTKIVKQLIGVKQNLQILVINGRDEDSFIAMDKFIRKHKNTNHLIYNYGFVNNVNEFMSASDVLVGKCGCISINESLNIELPLLGYGRLPYQEIKNIEILDANNCALKIQKGFNLKKALELVIKYPDIINNLRDNILKFRKVNALSDLFNFIMQLDNAKWEEDKIPTVIDNNEVIRLIREENLKNIKKKNKRKHHLKKVIKNDNN